MNRHTGAIAWELGGKQSSFRFRAAPGQVLDSAGEILAWQHEPEALGHGRYTCFDNESSGQLESNAELPAGVNTYRAYRLPWPSPAASGASG